MSINFDSFNTPSGLVYWKARNVSFLKPPAFLVFPIDKFNPETILLWAPGEPAPTFGDAWSEPATEDHVIRAWRSSWPWWTWHEFRGSEAEYVRDLLSGAHASMLHAGDIVVVRPGSHGDHAPLCRMLYS